MRATRNRRYFSLPVSGICADLQLTRCPSLVVRCRRSAGSRLRPGRGDVEIAASASAGETWKIWLFRSLPKTGGCWTVGWLSTGASKDLDICSTKTYRDFITDFKRWRGISLNSEVYAIVSQDNRGSQRRIEEQQGIGNTINDKKVWRFLFTAKCLREGGVMFGQAKYKHETVKNQESGACVLAMFIRI
nr:hypothetical protein Iba_chr02cCG5720 [Ipomoea batatas]